MRRDQELGKMLMLTGHEHRMGLMLDVADQFESGVAYWKAMRQTWETSELLGPHDPQLQELMAKHLDCRPAFMTQAERRELGKMPEMLTIYRGASNLNPVGWSWTLDESKAEWFARRWPVGKEAFVLNAYCFKVDVIGLLLGRDESEIVIRPWEVRGAHRIKDLGNLPMKNAGMISYLVRTGQW